MSHVGGKQEKISLSQQCQDTGGERWPHPSLPPIFTRCYSAPLCGLCLQVGATASGGEIPCVIQTSPVKRKLLKAHRSCVCSDAAVFSLAQHYPSAHTDTSSVWLLQIMETRNTRLAGTSPTGQALLRLLLSYPPAVRTASDMRRQSVWEENIKASACYGPFLGSCHLRSGLDTPVAKSPHFHRTGFIQSGDFV